MRREVTKNLYTSRVKAMAAEFDDNVKGFLAWKKQCLADVDVCCHLMYDANTLLTHPRTVPFRLSLHFGPTSTSSTASSPRLLESAHYVSSGCTCPH